MCDEIAIQQTLNRYTDGVARADVAQVLSTFIPDAVYEAGGMRFEGLAAIEEVATHYRADFAYLVQISSPATIVVEGDRATAHSVIRESGKYANADELLELVGIYSDELVRTVDSWKIARRSFSPIGAHRLPVLIEPDRQSLS